MQWGRERDKEKGEGAYKYAYTFPQENNSPHQLTVSRNTDLTDTPHTSQVLDSSGVRESINLIRVLHCRMRRSESLQKSRICDTF